MAYDIFVKIDILVGLDLFLMWGIHEIPGVHELEFWLQNCGSWPQISVGLNLTIFVRDENWGVGFVDSDCGEVSIFFDLEDLWHDHTLLNWAHISEVESSLRISQDKLLPEIIHKVITHNDI